MNSNSGQIKTTSISPSFSFEQLRVLKKNSIANKRSRAGPPILFKTDTKSKSKTDDSLVIKQISGENKINQSIMADLNIDTEYMKDFSCTRSKDVGFSDFRITNIVIDVKKKIKNRNKFILPPINIERVMREKSSKISFEN